MAPEQWEGEVGTRECASMRPAAAEFPSRRLWLATPGCAARPSDPCDASVLGAQRGGIGEERERERQDQLGCLHESSGQVYRYVLFLLWFVLQFGLV